MTNQEQPEPTETEDLTPEQVYERLVLEVIKAKVDRAESLLTSIRPTIEQQKLIADIMALY